MDDLISRQAAIDALLELVEVRRTWISTEAARKEISGIDASMCAIHDLPSAERRGRWERSIENPPVYVCTECGRTIETYNLDRYPYCHCGARMVEE